ITWSAGTVLSFWGVGVALSPARCTALTASADANPTTFGTATVLEPPPPLARRAMRTARRARTRMTASSHHSAERRRRRPAGGSVAVAVGGAGMALVASAVVI